MNPALRLLGSIMFHQSFHRRGGSFVLSIIGNDNFVRYVFTVPQPCQAIEELLQLWHSSLGRNQNAERGLHRDNANDLAGYRRISEAQPRLSSWRRTVHASCAAFLPIDSGRSSSCIVQRPCGLLVKANSIAQGPKQTTAWSSARWYPRGFPGFRTVDPLLLYRRRRLRPR